MYDNIYINEPVMKTLDANLPNNNGKFYLPSDHFTCTRTRNTEPYLTDTEVPHLSAEASPAAVQRPPHLPRRSMEDDRPGVT